MTYHSERDRHSEIKVQVRRAVRKENPSELVHALRCCAKYHRHHIPELRSAVMRSGSFVGVCHFAGVNVVMDRTPLDNWIIEYDDVRATMEYIDTAKGANWDRIAKHLVRQCIELEDPDSALHILYHRIRVMRYRGEYVDGEVIDYLYTIYKLLGGTKVV